MSVCARVCVCCANASVCRIRACVWCLSLSPAAQQRANNGRRRRTAGCSRSMPSGAREGGTREDAPDPAALFLSDCLSLGVGTTEERVPEEEGGEKRQRGASNLYIVAAAAASRAAVTSPRPCVAVRSVCEVCRSRFLRRLLTEKTHTTSQDFLQPGATTPLRCSWTRARVRA